MAAADAAVIRGKGKERKGGLSYSRTRGLVAYWRGPISEDAMRLLGTEQPASRGSSGTCRLLRRQVRQAVAAAAGIGGFAWLRRQHTPMFLFVC
jgi:hypothetical protein